MSKLETLTLTLTLTWEECRMGGEDGKGKRGGGDGEGRSGWWGWAIHWYVMKQMLSQLTPRARKG